MKKISFKDASIRIKLILIIEAAALMVLLIVVTAITVNEYWSRKHQTEHQLSLLANIISWNSSAALAFMDTKAAQKTLNVLQTRPDVVAAFLYNDQGYLFSEYQSHHKIDTTLSKNVIELTKPKNPNTHILLSDISWLNDMLVWGKHFFTLPDPPPLYSSYSEAILYDQYGQLHLLQPIVIDNQLIGVLELVDDLSGLHAFLTNFYRIISIIVLFTLISILFISTRLQRIFSEPLLDLMTAMKAVSKEKNYTTSVLKTSNDEIGQLVDVYNGMLIEINNRNKLLDNQRENLEIEVRERTAQLLDKNAALEQAVTETVEAQEASRSKSQFLANMSHEIRTPMNGVLGMAEILLSTELTDRQRRCAEIVHSSGQSLLSIINDILDFSKIEAGHFELENLDLNLYSAVEDVVDLFAEKAYSKDLELIYRIAANVPDGIKGDPTRLRQILSNLVNNAIKFTKRGNVIVDVRLEPSTISHTINLPQLRFQVIDTGIGISDNVKPRLFQAFSQADSSTTRQYGGTGLGLAICKQLVELMGGQIDVESRVGHGATFWFNIPFIPADTIDVVSVKESSELKNLKLLIVEDNEVNLEILHTYTASWGMHVNGVTNGATALQLLQQAVLDEHPYDLAIIDMKMANMNGLELGQTIKANPALAKIPLILLTSTLFKGEASEAKKTGFAAYITKPIRKKDLRQCLVCALTTDDNELTPSNHHIETALTSAEKLNGHILLADDNIVNQEVVLLMLQSFGCTADIANNGIEAIAAVERKTYDLILMDCMMPEMDGYAATAEIRHRQNAGQLLHFPIIALTANAIEGDREHCIKAGMDDYLAKPFKAENFLHILRTWLNHSGDDHNKSDVKETPQENPIIDLTALSALRALDTNNGIAILQRIISLYLNNAVTLILKLEKAWSLGDIENIRMASHTLKSSSHQVGASTLANLCRNVEDDARNQIYDTTGQALVAIKQHFHDSSNALTAYLESIQPNSTGTR